MPSFIPHLLDEDILANEKRRLGVKTLFTAGKSLVHLFLGTVHRVLHRSLVAIDLAVWHSATKTHCIRPLYITWHVIIPSDTFPVVYSDSITRTLSYLEISSMIALPPVQTPHINCLSSCLSLSQVTSRWLDTTTPIPSHDNTLLLGQWLQSSPERGGY